MIKQLLSLFLCVLVSILPACAVDDVGSFVRAGTGSIAHPVAFKTWIYDSTDGNLKVWDGSAWQARTLPKFALTGSGTPTVSTDGTLGYLPGSLYFDTAGKQMYLCADSTTGAAVWYQISNRIAAVDVLPKLTTADVFADWLVSGLIGSVPVSSLTMTTPGGVGIVGGSRIVSSGSTYAYSASSDTYDYLLSTGIISHVAVSNGAAQPTGQPGLLLQKVVSGVSAITSVTQLALSAPKQAVNATGLNLYTGSVLQAFASSPTANRTFSLPDANSNSVQPRGSATANQFLTYVDANGIQYSRQPVLSDLSILNGYMAVGNASGIGQAVQMSGDASMTNAGVVTVQKINNTTPAASATTDTTNASNITSGTLPAGRLPNPSASTLGGIQSKVATTSNWINSISTSGVPGVSQPAFSDISGTITSTQLPTTAVTPGSYTSVNVTFDAYGRATAASNGSTSTAFGGDGSSGATTKGSTTETTILQLNATTFTQSSSTTWVPKSGTIVNSTGAQTWSGTTNTATGNTGGGGFRNANGYTYGGEGGGVGGAGVSTMGANGAYGGGGSNGGAGGQAGSCSGTSTYPVLAPPAHDFMLVAGGGGSGGGGSCSAVTTYATGGNGGGLLMACSKGAITISGTATITCNGGAGVTFSGTATNGMTGGAGGAGGTAYFASQTSISNSGTISCNGGAGGNGVGTYATGGPGGGGGWIVFHSPSNTNGTRNVTGGAVGTGNSNATDTQTAGSSGQTLSIPGTPNLPIFAGLFNQGGLNKLRALALAHKVLNLPTREGFDVELTQREAALAASGGNVEKFARCMSDDSFERATCLGVGDFEELDNAA